MARYEHLPIYKSAMDLALEMEKTVRNMGRYDKYGIGIVAKQNEGWLKSQKEKKS